MSRAEGRPSVSELFYGSVTMGERGQVVIPAAARKQHGLQPGDKLLVFAHPHMCGLMLARLEDIRALLAELEQWRELVSGMAADADD